MPKLGDYGRGNCLSSGVDPNTHLLRRLAYAGARYGPTLWVRYSPALFGAAFALMLPEQRRRIRDNLRLVYGPRSSYDENRDVLRTFADYASCLAEALGAEREDGKRARIRARGEEHLQAALRAGRGAVLVTAHAGAWDCVGRLLEAEYRAPLMVVMQGEADERARALSDEVRSRTGVRVLVVGDDELSALPLLRHLSAGGVAAFQLDRPAPSRRSIEVELFGRSFYVPEGPFRIAAMSRALLLPMFVSRSGYFEYEICVSPALELKRRPSAEELERAARIAASAMESFIREHPTQWFHFHPARSAAAAGGPNSGDIDR